MKDKGLNVKLHITAFFAAALALFIAYAINGAYPFGTGSVLTADLQSQYHLEKRPWQQPLCNSAVYYGKPA